MRVLVTGTAGFIGFHVAKRLLDEHEVVGIDGMTPYYDVTYKRRRHAKKMRSTVRMQAKVRAAM